MHCANLMDLPSYFVIFHSISHRVVYSRYKSFRKGKSFASPLCVNIPVNFTVKLPNRINNQ